MAITSSVVTVEAPQIDGRRWVREVHSDAQGIVRVLSYLGASNVASTAQAVANQRAVVINEEMAELEAAELMNGA